MSVLLKAVFEAQQADFRELIDGMSNAAETAYSQGMDLEGVIVYGVSGFHGAAGNIVGRTWPYVIVDAESKRAASIDLGIQAARYRIAVAAFALLTESWTVERAADSTDTRRPSEVPGNKSICFLALSTVVTVHKQFSLTRRAQVSIDKGGVKRLGEWSTEATDCEYPDARGGLSGIVITDFDLAWHGYQETIRRG